MKESQRTVRILTLSPQRLTARMWTSTTWGDLNLVSLEVARDQVPHMRSDLALYIHAFRGAVRAAHTKSEGGLLRLLCHRPITVNLPEANSESVDQNWSAMEF